MRNAPAITAVKIYRTGVAAQPKDGVKADVIDDFEVLPEAPLAGPGTDFGPARAALDRLITSIPPDDAQKHRDLRAIKEALHNA